MTSGTRSGGGVYECMTSGTWSVWVCACVWMGEALGEKAPGWDGMVSVRRWCTIRMGQVAQGTEGSGGARRDVWSERPTVQGCCTVMPAGRRGKPVKRKYPCRMAEDGTSAGIPLEGGFYFAVAGLIVVLISVMLVMGKPPISACFRISDSFSALYTQKILSPAT